MISVLTELGFAKSNSEARRILKEGGASVNGVKVQGEDAAISKDDLLHGRFCDGSPWQEEPGCCRAGLVSSDFLYTYRGGRGSSLLKYSLLNVRWGSAPPFLFPIYTEPLRQEGLFLYRSAALCLVSFCYPLALGFLGLSLLARALGAFRPCFGAPARGIRRFLRFLEVF